MDNSTESNDFHAHGSKIVRHADAIAHYKVYLPRNATIASTPTELPPYENGIQDVPSHWIKLYGTAHGMFYDPLTKLFFGDGLPRATLRRGADGEMPAEADSTAAFEGVDDDPADAIHISSRLLMDRFANIAPGSRYRMYCRCNSKWIDEAHECVPAKAQPHPGQLILPGGTRFLPEWFTHSNVAVDTSYIHLVDAGCQVGQAPVAEMVDYSTLLYVNGGRTFPLPCHNQRPSSIQRVSGTGSPTFRSARRSTTSSLNSPRQYQQRMHSSPRFPIPPGRLLWHPPTF